MKVAYLFGSLNRGGTETLMLDVFRSAAKYQLNAIGFYRKAGVLENDFCVSGVKMIKNEVINPVLYIFKLRKLLKENKIQIVHAHQFIDAFWALFACKFSNIKIILTSHGYDYNIKGLSSLIHRFVIKRTNSNFFVSDHQRNYFQTKYHLKPDKQFVVYNGISFDKFNNELSSNTFRSELSVNNKCLLLGTVGNFVPGRDQFTICKFLKLLDREGVDFIFVFIGEKSEKNPELFNSCKQYISENKLDSKVLFLGSRNDVPAILYQLDSFIYATDHDTFGIALVEAMYAEIPVFVNDWPVMLEITDNGKHATIYITKDEYYLLQKFMDFLKNRETYLEQARESSDYVANSFNIQQHIKALKDVYEKLLLRK